MKRQLAFVIRHGTVISLGLVIVTWIPPMLIWAFADNTWATFGWLLICAVLAVLWSSLGTLLSVLAAIREERKRWALIALAANLLSLVMWLGAFIS